MMTPDDYRRWIALLYDDAYAACFQTMAQYRMALIQRARQDAIVDLAKNAPTPIAKIRVWTEHGDGHSDVIEWCEGIEKLPDGEHLLYSIASPPPQPITPEPEDTNPAHS